MTIINGGYKLPKKVGIPVSLAVITVGVVIWTLPIHLAFKIAYVVSAVIISFGIVVWMVYGEEPDEDTRED